MVDVNSYLTKLANHLVIDPDLKNRIEISISHLKQNIWGLFQDRLLEVNVFGSFDRETFVSYDANADVDIIIVFKQKEFQPETYLKQIRTFCEKNYSRSDIYPDHPTIVIEMEHIKFEIIPSWNYSNETVKIPAPRTKELKWIATSPKGFKNKLILKDKNNKGNIIPLIRIIKYWNSLNENPFTSYELERFIVEKSYSCLNLKDYYITVSKSFEEIGKTAEQKKLIINIKEKIRRLKVLENYNIPEYLEQELSSFLPLPKKK